MIVDASGNVLPRDILTASSPEMAALIARKDWSETSLGDARNWPAALRMMLDVTLVSRFPGIFWWGPEFVQFYNDAYRDILGTKHPAALGQSPRECWAEIWHIIGPQIESVFAGGPATWNEDLLLEVHRFGFLEETYFTFSYSALPDPTAPNGIGGVLATVQETTEKVIAERRIRLLRDLAAHGTEARSVVEECRVAVQTLDRNPDTVPFSLIYLCDSGSKAKLAAASGMSEDHVERWQLDAGFIDGVRLLDRTDAFVSALPPQCTAAGVKAIVAPIPSNVPNETAGILIAGINPKRPFDDKYRDFYALVASQIGTAIAGARAYEDEKRRAEALAEIDRAKNVFFSNVSHEFRTPLTLMLGPLSELERNVDERSKPLVEAAHRNALRLLKLVNTLLDFSRLEAGRSDATYVQTDIAALTEEICSVFHSAIEHAGLTLSFHAELHERVFVDRTMWEKIVLNLLSNALKFTLEGGIEVTLRRDGDFAQMFVRDTGAGIPLEEQPHVFERFRRVRTTQSRSHEGSGIGLALVQDLVELHGGTIDLESQPGIGTTFRVRIPLGTAHLDPALVVTEPPESQRASSIVEQYLADVDATITRSSSPASTTARHHDGAATRARILVADDNGDLRDYVTRILSPHYDVTTVRNGVEALDEARAAHHDLIVSDVMMPEMDGIELLGAIRRDSQLATTPFILLSARAGEEAAVEGVSHGADDYVVKPFSAEELLARVRAHLAAAPLREHAWQISEERFRAFANQVPIMIWQHDPSGAIVFSNDTCFDLSKMPRDPESQTPAGWRRVVHPDDLPDVMNVLNDALENRAEYRFDFRMRPVGGDEGSYRWYAAEGKPYYVDGTFRGWLAFATDVHDVRSRELLERKLREQAMVRERVFHTFAETIPVIAWSADASGWIDWYNSRWYEYTGQTIEEAAGWGWQAAHHPEDFLRVMEAWPHSIATGEPFEMEFRLRGRDGSFRWFLTRVEPDFDENGNVVRWYGSNVDVQAQRESIEQSRRVAETLQGVFLPETLPHTDDVRFDAVYVAAERDALIGGDWFDAARLPDGRFLVSIGDVTGHGLDASVIAGTLRQAITGFALTDSTASEILEQANHILRFQHPEIFATALVGLIDRDCTKLSYACAGHPSPLLAERGDAQARALPHGGLPLGVDDDLHLATSEVALSRDAVLAFYTDGLTEYARDMSTAETRLAAAVGAVVGDLSDPRPARTVLHAVLGDVRPVDDIALLIAQFSHVSGEVIAHDPTRYVKRWRFHSSDANSARAARHELMHFIRQDAHDPDELFKAELILGEILANTVEHAPGLVEVTVDWTNEKPVVTALDTGSGFDRARIDLPADALDEGGRGLFLIAQLADEVSIRPAKGYGTEVRVVLPVTRR